MQNLTLIREQANVNFRAQNLFDAGYSIEVNNALTSGPVFLITSPKGEKYAVDPLTKTCTCAYFQKKNADKKPFGQKVQCKHRLGAEKLLKDQTAYEAAQIAQAETYLMEEANAEDIEWGCSPL